MLTELYGVTDNAMMAVIGGSGHAIFMPFSSNRFRLLPDFFTER
jgi:hypothetical protein